MSFAEASDSSAVLEGIRRFLRIAMVEPGVRLERLALALDEMAALSHVAPPGAQSGQNADPPRRKYERTREVLGSRFPDLGLYGLAEPLQLLGQPMIGDGIDDLADIVGELEEVVWRWEVTGPDDACWHFRSMYGAHWGRHLHDLRSYIHALLFERRDAATTP